MPDEKPYISQSRLGMLGKCPEQYRRRYEENEIIPPGVAMARGVGVHGAAKGNFRQKIESHEDLPTQDIIDIAVSEFDRVLKRGVRFTPEEESRGAEVVIGETRDTTAGLATVFAEEVAPAYQPEMVEQKQRIVLPEAPFDLVAILDLMTTDGYVVDLKTSSKSPGLYDADQSEQLTFYALVYKALKGELPVGVSLEVLVETPAQKKRYRKALHSTRTIGDLTALVNRINMAVKLIDAGVFIPTNPSNWWCDSRWCGYFNTCKYVNSNRR